MTHTNPSLTALLAQHLGREAGALAPKLAANDPAAIRELQRRTQKNINDHSTLSPNQQRRFLLAFALLDHLGDALPADHDHVLRRALPGLSDTLFMALGDPLRAALDKLPPERREPLRRALLHVAFTNLHHLPARHTGLLPWLPDEARDELIALLQHHATDAPVRLLHGVPRSSIQLLASLQEVQGDLTAPPWVEPLLLSELKQLDSDVQNTWLHPDLARATQLLPEDRLLALLTPLRRLPANAPALCTTPALARLALQRRPRNGPPWANVNLFTHLSQQPHTHAPLVEALLHNDPDKANIWTSLHPHLIDPAHLLSLLHCDDPDIAQHCAVKLTGLSHALAAEPTLQHLLHTQHRPARLLCARALRTWSLTADMTSHLHVALASADQQDLRAILLDAARDPHERLQQAWTQHQHLLQQEPTPPDLKKANDVKQIRIGQQYAYNRLRPNLEILLQALRARWDEPGALLLALEAVPQDKEFAREYLQNIDALFGAALPPALTLWLDQGRGHEYHWELFTWLNQRAAPTDAAVMTAFLHGDKPAAEGALQRLAARGEAVIPTLSALLREGAPKQRVLAARALGALGLKSAAPALRDALAAERAKAPREALQQALQSCDPTLRRIQQASRDLGVYDPHQPLRLNDGLEQLRALLYEDTSLLAWVRLCDLLERLDAIGALSLGVDYLTDDALARWPDEHRVAPDGWDQRPLLRALPKHTPETPWFPLARLTRPGHWDTELKPALDLLEKGTRSRRFSQDLVSIFLQETRRAWRWCEAQGAPLDKLELRVDGGAIAKNFVTTSQTTAMELWQGFGVTLQRRPIRKEGEGGPPGLRYARVALPARHPLRDQLGMVGHTRYFELPSDGAES